MFLWQPQSSEGLPHEKARPVLPYRTSVVRVDPASEVPTVYFTPQPAGAWIGDPSQAVKVTLVRCKLDPQTAERR